MCQKARMTQKTTFTRIFTGSNFQRKSLFISGLLSISYKYRTKKEELWFRIRHQVD